VNVGTPLALESVEWRREGGGSDKTVADMTVVVKGDRRQVSGKGNGSLDAASHALRLALGGIVEFHFADYAQHAIETDSDARAAAYVKIQDKSAVPFWGVGVHNDITMASVLALMSAVNRTMINSQKE